MRASDFRPEQNRRLTRALSYDARRKLGDVTARGGTSSAAIGSCAGFCATISARKKGT